jgi:hypothetical protein
MSVASVHTMCTSYSSRQLGVLEAVLDAASNPCIDTAFLTVRVGQCGEPLEIILGVYLRD